MLRHLSRQCPEASALAAVSETQLMLLKDAVLKWSWSPEPTVGEVTGAIAKLGGHLKSNGRPGWLVLGRGYQELRQMQAGWEAARRQVKALLQSPDGLEAARRMAHQATSAEKK